MVKFDELLKYISPVLTLLVGVSIAFYKFHLKTLRDKIENIKDENEKDIKDLCTKFDKKQIELMKTMSDNLKTERRFNQDIQKRHDDLIDELFDKKVSKELCEEKHRERK